jgi:hypothetical protein
MPVEMRFHMLCRVDFGAAAMAKRRLKYVIVEVDR